MRNKHPKGWMDTPHHIEFLRKDEMMNGEIKGVASFLQRINVVIIMANVSVHPIATIIRKINKKHLNVLQKQLPTVLLGGDLQRSQFVQIPLRQKN